VTRGEKKNTEGAAPPFDEEQVCLVLMAMEHGESLRGASVIAGVAIGTFLGWVAADEELAEHYTRARERLMDIHAEEILLIADTPLIGVKTKTNEKGEVETTEGDMIEHRRLQVDARKWLLSKLAPKKYGDKLETTLKGGLRVVSASELKDDELAAIATGGGG
jgi:hypothetical protein